MLTTIIESVWLPAMSMPTSRMLRRLVPVQGWIVAAGASVSWGGNVGVGSGVDDGSGEFVGMTRGAWMSTARL
jgi:hypothetical protein